MPVCSGCKFYRVTPKPLRHSRDPPQPRTAPQPLSLSAKLRQETNRDTVTIIASDPFGGFLYTAYDIAAVLERKAKFRVIPVVGKGGAQNLKDVLYLSGIDMGIMHPRVIKHFNKTGEIGRNVDRRIAYITPLSRMNSTLLPALSLRASMIFAASVSILVN